LSHNGTPKRQNEGFCQSHRWLPVVGILGESIYSSLRRSRQLGVTGGIARGVLLTIGKQQLLEI